MAVFFHSISSSDSVEGSGHGFGSRKSQRLTNDTVIPKKPEREETENTSASKFLLTTSPANTPHHLQPRDQEAEKANTSIIGDTDSSGNIMTEDALFKSTHITTEEQPNDSQTPIVNVKVFDGEDNPELPVQTNAFTSMTNQNLLGHRNPCVLGLRPCVALKNFNGTNLQWDDMKRTLAFAWELHVFGSASLFILMAVLALLGMAGACTCPHPLCDALTVANSLLIMSGTLRGVLLLLDPYGTLHILSRPTLAALHNIPLQLFLWTQVALSLAILRGMKLLFFPLKLQHPWVVGGLAISHCTLLLVADLYSTTLSPALPLWLQTLSLCWGLPLCMGILTKSLSHIHPFLRSSVPQWIPSQRVEKRAKQVTAVCAFLGVLGCTLQMYSILWLYGLLGNWRHFGWGWWLSQFWARILELAWGFTLLVLGSWIIWIPSKSHSRLDQWKGRSEVSKGVDEKSLWGRVTASLRKGPLRKSEKTWEDLMPNNWAKYNLSRAGISSNVMSPYDDKPSTIIPEYNPNPVSNSSTESQAALLWQKVGECECILSLIEFDMGPPSPINLRRSIDNALHHGQLVAGGLFTPPPLFWTQTVDTDATDGDGGTTFPSAYVSYGWMLDAESISPFLDHFQAKDTTQSPIAASDYGTSIGSPIIAHQGEDFNTVLSSVMHQYDWSDDYVTDL
ncbi:Proline-rich transmembrane protein 3 Precursor [Channa argus]|uniref:Proline-rich transmembrane protein 3 n=1 Tax=Channa argus TaxID=215402 RepID=A0A6G1PHU9_CHAAH|nr:Proline-rich transmembrane protein 3 Precursor [Channa argus]